MEKDILINLASFVGFIMFIAYITKITVEDINNKRKN